MFLFFAISLKLLAVSQSLFKKQQKFKKFHFFKCFRLEMSWKQEKMTKGVTELSHVGKLSLVYFQKPELVFWEKINLKFP